VFIGGSWHLPRLGRGAIGSARQDPVEPLGEREAAGVRCGSRSKARHLVGTAASKHEKPRPEVQQRLRRTGEGQCLSAGRVWITRSRDPADPGQAGEPGSESRQRGRRCPGGVRNTRGYPVDLVPWT
jgi:hypothetical protein